MQRYVSWMTRLIEAIVTLLMGIVVCAVIVEVVLRSFFDASLIVTDEASRYLMTWTAMLAAVLLVKEDGHMRISLVSDAFPGRVRDFIDGLSHLIAATFLVILIVTTIRIMPSVAQQRTVTLGISMVWIYLALPVAASLMLPLLLGKAWQCFSGRRQPEPGSKPGSGS